MSRKAKVYKLVTLKDVFDKVPTDRIPDCMKELGTLLQSAKAMSALIRHTAQAIADADDKGIRLPKKLFALPDEFVWVDDGKGHIQTNFKMGDEHSLSVSIEREAE